MPKIKKIEPITSIPIKDDEYVKLVSHIFDLWDDARSWTPRTIESVNGISQLEEKENKRQKHNQHNSKNHPKGINHNDSVISILENAANYIS